jgi:hypothetical protein
MGVKVIDIVLIKFMTARQIVEKVKRVIRHKIKTSFLKDKNDYKTSYEIAQKTS